MAEPTKKAEAIESLITGVFGTDRRDAIQADKCIDCGGAASEFRNEISRQEYRISGLCQKCQDSVYGVD